MQMTTFNQQILLLENKMATPNLNFGPTQSFTNPEQTVNNNNKRVRTQERIFDTTFTEPNIQFEVHTLQQNMQQTQQIPVTFTTAPASSPQRYYNAEEDVQETQKSKSLQQAFQKLENLENNVNNAVAGLQESNSILSHFIPQFMSGTTSPSSPPKSDATPSFGTVNQSGTHSPSSFHK